jgi:sugar lactone lactonase YvrE
MPAFGGADLKTLYVTTARDKSPPTGTGAGGELYSLRVDVPGLPNPLFNPQV